MVTRNLRSVYQLKVTLQGIQPPIWRRILIASTENLEDLHFTLQVVMGWTNSHLHEFMLNHWPALNRDLDEGFLKPDNNKAEQHIRPIALGRKNYLFVGSDRGGKAAATYYSLVESCKNYQVNPLTFLTDILTTLPECKSNNDYHALTPDQWLKHQTGR